MRFYFRKLIAPIVLWIIFTGQPATAIENGNDAQGNEFVVFVMSSWNSTQILSCSGALLNEYVVVTAAHCVNDETGMLSKKIRVSPPGVSIQRDLENRILNSQFWTEVDSTSITLTYQSGSENVTDDDLAFLTLKEPFKLNVNVRLASENDIIKLKQSSSPLRIYGYGHTSDSGKYLPNPQYYTAEFENRQHTLANSAYAKSSVGNACSGDSGGPVVNVTPTSITVVGVISGAPPSNKCTLKSVDGFYRATFTLLNRYANLAFSTTTKIASNLNTLSGLKIDLENAKRSVSDLDSQITKWKSDFETLRLENEKLKLEIDDLKKQLPISIKCVKGKLSKKITGVNPKCPTGFRLNKN